MLSARCASRNETAPSCVRVAAGRTGNARQNTPHTLPLATEESTRREDDTKGVATTGTIMKGALRETMLSRRGYVAHRTRCQRTSGRQPEVQGAIHDREGGDCSPRR